MSTASYYPTDMTEAQWTLVLPLLPARKWRAGGPAGASAVRPTGRAQWDLVPPQDGLSVAQ